MNDVEKVLAIFLSELDDDTLTRIDACFRKAFKGKQINKENKVIIGGCIDAEFHKRNVEWDS